METITWTKKMITEMAFGYAHGAHEANGQMQGARASLLANISVAWSQVAQAMGPWDTVELVLEAGSES